MNCPKCGLPLYKGNIKVIRKNGKRPRRVHRKCPPKPGTLGAIIKNTRIICDNCPDRPNCIRLPGQYCPKLDILPKGRQRKPAEAGTYSWNKAIQDMAGLNPGGDTTGDGLQRPCSTTGGPEPWEGMVSFPPPPLYRYFMTQDQAEKVKASVERNANFGFGIAFEVIPVLEEDVEREPDRYADLVEVTVEWKE